MRFALVRRWWRDVYKRQLFDAADTYGNGRSEIQLAKAFRDRRERVVYATKFGYDWYNHSGERKGQQEIEHDFSPKFVRFALEESLKRLETDYIDIWQMHNAHLEQAVSYTHLGAGASTSPTPPKRRPRAGRWPASCKKPS